MVFSGSGLSATSGEPTLPCQTDKLTLPLRMPLDPFIPHLACLRGPTKQLHQLVAFLLPFLGMSTFSTKGGLYERAQKKYKLSDGKTLFTYTFFDRRRLEAQVCPWRLGAGAERRTALGLHTCSVCSTPLLRFRHINHPAARQRGLLSRRRLSLRTSTWRPQRRSRRPATLR